MKLKTYWLSIVLVISLIIPVTAMAAQPVTPAGNSSDLEKQVLIHYKNGSVKPVGGNDKRGTQNYSLLGKGVKWKKQSVDYVINPINTNNLSEEFVANAVYNAMQEWDDHTNSTLFGNQIIDYNANWNNSAPDYKNEISFGDYSDPNVIAITIIWGRFGGPVENREITEYDILFNTKYVWGDGISNSNVMDLQNIATHEIGHGIGLGDLYTVAGSEETMYGYSTYGETKKRDLNTGDLQGLHALYGN